MDDRLSIVVPLSCGVARAQRCLEAIAAAPPRPEFEVVIVADAAPWLEPLLHRLDGDLAVVTSDRPLGSAGALARGLEHAGAPVIALLAGAALPGPRWLEPLLELLRDPTVGTAFHPAPGGPASALTAPAAAWRTDDARAALAAGVPDGAPAIAALALALAQLGLRTAAAPAGAVTANTGAVEGPHPPGSPLELTIVVPTLDAASPRTRRCLDAIRHCTDAAHQVVVVDNGAPAQGFSAPVNAGLRAAATPYAVVMNDDVEVLPGWWAPLRAALDGGAAVAFPLTVGGAMRTDFAAWCFAVARETLTEFAHGPGDFFDPALAIWFQDTDLFVRLRDAGRPPRLVAESRIRHGLSQTLADPAPRLRDWVRSQVAIDERRFRDKHPEVELVQAGVKAVA